MARRHVTEEAPEIAIPVTPMLDMTFQLLTFFIFTYHPLSVVEGQMDFTLPATGDAKARTQDQVDPDRPSDTDLSPKGALTVTIKAQPGSPPTGEIGHIKVQMPNGGRELSFNQPEELANYLKTIRDTKDLENKNDIQIQADSALKYARVIRVIDLCRSAKFEGIGFAPPEEQGAAKQ